MGVWGMCGESRVWDLRLWWEELILWWCGVGDMGLWWKELVLWGCGGSGYGFVVGEVDSVGVGVRLGGEWGICGGYVWVPLCGDVGEV